jgi:crotonobetainyl-CoA:carnitine CoA-transferase CaiB-like acyl-CoA transferase
MQELEKRLRQARIAVGRFRTVEDFLGHPAITERRRRTSIASPVGQLEALLPPIDWAGQTASMGAVPSLGQHTEAVLRELGISAHDERADQIVA